MTEVPVINSDPLRQPGEGSGAAMIFEMRLLLSISALLTLFIAPADVGTLGRWSWVVFVAYLVHSAVLFVIARFWRYRIHYGKLVYWVDLAWYGLMVYVSGGGNSFFVPFFFFVILTASFQWGFDEGARIALASACVMSLAALMHNRHTDIGHLLLRATFVLALGYMIAYWGGLGVAQRRRLALLRNVSRLSNPRFGVDHTIASVLEQTRHFYGASTCVLLMRDGDSDNWLLRSSNQHRAGQPAGASLLGSAAAGPLLALPALHTVLYAEPLHPRLAWTREARTLAPGQRRWSGIDDVACRHLADLFDACAFISAPLPLRKGEGRIYVVSASHRFSSHDATFLHQLAAQAFPVIENIELLDRLAMDAAFRERQKIARDLHDTTIQPYIGLRHALMAMRQGAAADNPLASDLDRLISMSAEVIGDMRNFARKVRKDSSADEPELMIALRRQASQMQEFYGIDITLRAAAGLMVSDRLAAEVFQIVNEGMSNIRKHTRARAGGIMLSGDDGWLRIDIENDNPEQSEIDFLPGSIAERAAALGGTIRVETGLAGATMVRVAIPV